MGNSPFNVNNFIRQSGSVSFETEAVMPADFSDTTWGTYGGKTYAQCFSVRTELEFARDFPNWEAFADYFVKRRPVYRITGAQTCDTDSFRASDITACSATGKVTVANMAIPGGFQGNSIPDGKWQNDGMSWNDRKDCFTDVTISYVQYLEWKIEKVQEGTPPSPTKGSAT